MIDSLLQALRQWASRRGDVRGLVLVGSHARAERPADPWSDVDVVVVADEPDRLLRRDGWLSDLGTVVLSHVEPAAVGALEERRVLFDDGLEVDFTVVRAADLESLASDATIAAVLRRGHRILHDEIGLEETLRRAARLPEPPGAPVGALASEFWYRAHWAAKKLARGEAWMARCAVEGGLKWLLLEIARAQAPGDTWHSARFAEEWAPRTVDVLWRATAAAPSELADVIRRLCAHVEEATGAHPRMRRRIDDVLSHAE